MPNRPAPLVIVYGPPKVGGTVLGAAVALGADGLIIGAAQDLEPIHSFLGVETFNAEYLTEKNSTVADLTKLINRYAGKKKHIYIDDASYCADRSFAGQKWKAIEAEMTALAIACREAAQADTSIIIRFHEQPARISSGKPVRGGPRLPGQEPERFCGKFSIVFRIEHEPTAKPWPFVLRTRADKDWIAGDRYTIFPNNSPLNIAEGLRVSGREVSYPAGLGWIGKFVANVAPQVEVDIENWKKILREAAAKIPKAVNPRHAQWAISDTLHHAQFEHSRKQGYMDWLKDEDDINDLIK